MKTISAIPLNTQKFKTITINNNIRFLDSFAFLPDSLSKLADQLKASDSDFNFLDDMVTSKMEKSLLVRKGVYPYGYATSIARLEKTTSLPKMADFKNDMDGTDISQEDYAHAQLVWHTFGIRNMLEYTLVYVKTDVRLLAQAITGLRDNVWDQFGLNITSYLSLPMLTKDMESDLCCLYFFQKIINNINLCLCRCSSTRVFPSILSMTKR